MPKVLLVPDLPIEQWPSMDRYALRLRASLATEAPHYQFQLAGEIDALTDEAAPTRMVHPATVSEWRRYISRYWSYPRTIRHTKADLVHILDHSYAHMLRATTAPAVVVTVHDLIPVLTLQRKVTSLRDRVRNHLLERVLASLRRADAWIVSTEWLRAQLAEWLGVDGKIHVVPYGVDDAFFEEPDGDRETARAHWNIPKDAFVVLHVGSVGARKNFNTVIATVDGLRTKGVNAYLFQVGGTLTVGQQQDIANRSLHGTVVALGAVGESHLRSAYRMADALLFPSHYEGFGFPVLEAMASQLPVVTSGAGGLSEVVGDAAIVLGGREVQPYVEAMQDLASDDMRRQELIARGITRAKAFRWSHTARRTAAVYDTLR